MCFSINGKLPGQFAGPMWSVLLPFQRGEFFKAFDSMQSAIMAHCLPPVPSGDISP